VGARVLGYTLLVLFALIYIYPFLIQVATSFKTDSEPTSNALSLWPHPFTTAAFHKPADVDYPHWFLNSAFVTVCVTLGRSSSTPSPGPRWRGCPSAAEMLSSPRSSQ
jgi:multiple sugar transport system permease protein